MALEVFKLFGSVFVDNTKADQSLSKTEKKAGGLAASFATAGKKIAKGAAVVTGAAAAIGGAMIANAKSVAEYGDAVDKNSQKMGVSAKFYQEWDAVLQHSGTSMEQMGGLFKKMARTAQDASDDQVAAFERLGLSMDEVKQMSAEDLFANVVAGLQGMEEGTERTAIATELLGGKATELGALFNTSAGDTQAMIDQVNALGGVMSDQAIKDAAAFEDSLQDLTTGFDSLRKGIGAEFMPVLTDLMNRAIEALPEIKEKFDSMKETAETAFSVIMDMAGAAGEKLNEVKDFVVEHQTALENLAIVVGSVVLAFGLYNGALAVTAGFTALAGMIGGIAAAVGTLTTILSMCSSPLALFNALWVANPLGVVVAAITAVIAAGVLLYKNWDKVKGGAKALISFVSSGFNGLKNTVSNVWNSITTTITTKMEAAKNKVQGVIDKIKSFFSFKITWPKIPMPHFSVSPSGWKIGDLLKGSIPSLGIKWYGKAYDHPVMMDGPTAFGTDGRNLLMGGERRGREIVAGEEKLATMLSETVQAANGAQLAELIQLLRYWLPKLAALQVVMDTGATVGALRDPMDEALGAKYARYARGRS